LSEHHDASARRRRGYHAAGVCALGLVLVLGTAACGDVLGQPSPPEAGDEPILQPADDEDFVILHGQPLDREPAAGTGGATATTAPGSPTSPPPTEPPIGAARARGADGPPVAADPGGSLVTAVGLGLLALVSLALTGISAAAVWRTLHAWRSVDVSGGASGEHDRLLGATGFGMPAGPPARSFSLLVPAGQGAPAGVAGLGTTLDHLAALDHPRVEVVAIVDHDDPGARRVADEAAARHRRVRVVVDRNFRKSTGRALNAALAGCRGEVVGVFQAGDQVHRQLLRHVDATMAETGAVAVQGGVRPVGLGRDRGRDRGRRARWTALRHALDRYFWFRSRLHSHARQGFTPLEPTTAFVRADVLGELGGWTEDGPGEGVELGVRLAVAGSRVAVAYDPVLDTRVPAPETRPAVAAAEARWLAGFVRAGRRGAWRRLPTRRQRLLARATLAQPVLQALAAAVAPPAAVAAVALGAPAPVVVAALVPCVPLLVRLVVESAGLAEMCRTRGERARLRDRLGLALTAVPHHLVLGLAAVRALGRDRRTSGAGSPDTAAAPDDASASTDARRRALAGPASRRSPALGPDRRGVVDLATRRREPTDAAAIRAGALDR
jgi:hypothetical protein